ncbi:MAG: co-chaperone GroES [Anaerolineae bacterium]|jgi:chaperonin GroES
MRIEPLGARVLVRPVEDEQTFAGGKLVLPDTAREQPHQGIIEATGDADEMLTDLDIGDRVIFSTGVGTPVHIEGVQYLLIDEADVLARVRE